MRLRNLRRDIQDSVPGARACLTVHESILDETSHCGNRGGSLMVFTCKLPVRGWRNSGQRTLGFALLALLVLWPFSQAAGPKPNAAPEKVVDGAHYDPYSPP